MSSVLNKPKYAPIIENYFNKALKKDGITDLNTAFSKEGAFIHIPKNKLVEKPIQIIHFSSGNDSSLMLQPRNLIIVDENSQLQIVERHQNLNKNEVLTNSVTEIFVNPKSIVDYYKIQNDNKQASLIDTTSIVQENNSVCTLHTFSFGGKLTRNNLTFSQRGEHIESMMKGITIIEEKQHVDHNTLVHHIKPNCESHQDYKGIFDDSSTGVFNGTVVVEKEAQKTNAFQANNNVLLSDKASINTKPQLEIFADDVKCSHGCTIGQLDKNALFYLKSRGIPEKEAKALLMYGFANNVMQSVKIPELK
jgi:Fe-S cluster assembly protein SufD